MPPRAQLLVVTALATLCPVALGACSHSRPAERVERPRRNTAARSTEPAVAAAAAPVPTPAAPTTSIVAKQVAAEEQASFVVEIKFAEGTTALTTEHERALARVLERARSTGTIDDVEVITWADEEYPSVHTKTLSDQQRKIAELRGMGIKRHLQSLATGVTVKNYNMAERPNALAELFGTSNARIKKSLEVAGIPNTDTSVKTPSRASIAIVMVIVKD